MTESSANAPWLSCGLVLRWLSKLKLSEVRNDVWSALGSSYTASQVEVRIVPSWTEWQLCAASTTVTSTPLLSASLHTAKCRNYLLCCTYRRRTTASVAAAAKVKPVLITISQSTKWWRQISSFVQPTIQNPKTLNLLQRSSKSFHLRSWSQQKLDVFAWDMTETRAK